MSCLFYLLIFYSLSVVSETSGAHIQIHVSTLRYFPFVYLFVFIVRGE